MRALMWFSLGFAAACAVGAYLISGIWLLILGAVSLLAVVAFGILGSKREKLRILAVIFTGCTAGFLWYLGFDHFYIQPLRQYDNQRVAAEVVLTDYPVETAYGMSAPGSVSVEGKNYRTRVYFDNGGELNPGDRLEGTFSFKLAAAGGTKESRYLQGDGILLLAYAEDSVQVSIGSCGIRYYPALMRRKIGTLIQGAFPVDTSAFAAALLLGDDTGIDYATDTALKLSGIRHIIAVSGLHVSILFSLVYRLVGRKRYLTALLALPVLFLFAAAAGFTPSVVRAAVMQGLMILAMLFRKEYDAPTALAFAVLAMLGVNPLAIQSVSLQLSAGCLVGIFLFSERISGYLLQEKRLGTGKGRSLRAKLTRWLSGSISVSVGAMAVTTPLSAYYFGTVSVVSILTNLLTLWIVTLTFYGIMAVCVLSTIWLPIGEIAAWMISWLIRYVKLVAVLLSKIPVGAVYTNSIYIVLWLVFAYLLVTVFLRSKKKQPLLLTGCIAVSLLVSVAVSWIEGRLDPWRVTVLDVGQGQSILLQSSGSCFLVDCGGSSDAMAADAAAQELLSQGVFSLDGLILTHYDSDHAGGVEMLLSRIPAERLFLPDIPDSGNIRQALARAYEEQITWICDEQFLVGDHWKLSLYPGEKGKEENESSMCVLFQSGNYDILITGDRNTAGERYLLEQAKLPEVELLIAGHHGAGSSTGFELLSAVRPQSVAISVGERNAFGHPDGGVLRRLELFGCAVYRTDQCGTIVFRR